MIFEGGILDGMQKFHRNLYLNGTVVPFDMKTAKLLKKGLTLKKSQGEKS